MKYVDEFRDKAGVEKLAGLIREAADPAVEYTIMEVCGTHTMNIFRFGLKVMLPKNIRLISGPGCPVCVTPNDYIDKAIALSGLENVIVTTFGDMLRVPGSHSSLERAKALGNDIRMVYSSMDALDMAARNPGKEVVFLGVGFETTTPTVAVSILEAKKKRIGNYSVLCGHKTMPEVLKSLANAKGLNVDSFLLPGHVCTITGVEPYRFLGRVHKKRCVIAGFEPTDILQGVLMLMNQKTPKVEVQYTRVIETLGNAIARKMVSRVFEKSPSAWRGMGMIRKSGLRIRKGFSKFDAEEKFAIKVKPSKEDRRCLCGDVLKGIKTPLDCRLFGKACTPNKPIGACMVSSEGTCAAYYRYGRDGKVSNGRV
ncbi:MAG: hydrogenase formation protein HypD [Candidatus Omnitrophota bacterium]|jgi:hydrogenase expression/formation protein HypD